MPYHVEQDQPGLDCRVPRVAATQPAGRRGAGPHRHRHRQGLDPQRSGGESRRPGPGEREQTAEVRYLLQFTNFAIVIKFVMVR